MKALFYILTFGWVLSSILLAVSDALKVNNKTIPSKYTEIAGLSIVIAILCFGYMNAFAMDIYQIAWLVVSLGLLRLAVYNISYVVTYNIARKGNAFKTHLPLGYLGEDPIDSLFKGFLSWTNFPQGLFMINVYIISFVLGLSFISNYVII